MRVINSLERLELGHYERALDAYLARTRSVPAVRGVATMGSVKAPGLSDLDVIVVLPDDYDGAKAEQLGVDGLDRRVFLHGPLILTESQALRIQHILFASDLRVVWGEARFETFEELPAVVRTALALAYVIDFTEGRLCQFARVTDELDMRAWMTRLWSFVHTQRLCEIAGVALRLESQDVIERIRAMRRAWVAGERIDEGEFVELFGLASGVATEVFQSALGELEVRLGARVDEWPTIRCRNRNKRILCEASRETVEVVGRRVKVGPRSRLYETTLAPSRYALQLHLYGFVRWPALALDSGNPTVQIARRRAEAVRGHDRFLGRFGFSFALRGNLGLNAKREFIPAWVDRLIWMGIEMGERSR